MQNVVRMMAVLSLECTPETVLQRIQRTPAETAREGSTTRWKNVECKLEIFRRRTAPLMDYYRSRHTGIIGVDVGPATSSVEMLESIERRGKAIDNGPAQP